MARSLVIFQNPKLISLLCLQPHGLWQQEHGTRVVAMRTTFLAIPARGYPSNPPRQILSGQVCPSETEKGRMKFSGLLTTKEKSPNLWAHSSHSLYFWKRNQTKRPHPLTKSGEQWKLSKNSPHVRTKNAPLHIQKSTQLSKSLGGCQALLLAYPSPRPFSFAETTRRTRWYWIPVTKDGDGRGEEIYCRTEPE